MGDSDSENEGSQTNVNRLVIRPPGHTGDTNDYHQKIIYRLIVVLVRECLMAYKYFTAQIIQIPQNPIK